MTPITKENCLEKICNIPLNFEIENKSFVNLLKESRFEDFYNEITKQDVKEYILRHINLIDNWKIWSEDKRTSGHYLSIIANKYIVGSLNKDGKESFSKSFATAEEACAEFILREVYSILDVKD